MVASLPDEDRKPVAGTKHTRPETARKTVQLASRHMDGGENLGQVPAHLRQRVDFTDQISRLVRRFHAHVDRLFPDDIGRPRRIRRCRRRPGLRSLRPGPVAIDAAQGRFGLRRPGIRMRRHGLVRPNANQPVYVEMMVRRGGCFRDQHPVRTFRSGRHGQPCAPVDHDRLALDHVGYRRRHRNLVFATKQRVCAGQCQADENHAQRRDRQKQTAMPRPRECPRIRGSGRYHRQWCLVFFRPAAHSAGATVETVPPPSNDRARSVPCSRRRIVHPVGPNSCRSTFLKSTIRNLNRPPSRSDMS